MIFTYINNIKEQKVVQNPPGGGPGGGYPLMGGGKKILKHEIFMFSVTIFPLKS